MSASTPAGPAYPAGMTADPASSTPHPSEGPATRPKPVRDLDQLLASLAPELDEHSWVFTLAEGAADQDVRILAAVEEAEGRTEVITQAEADRLGRPYDYVAAHITLRVASALDAVGLTAAVSTALAEAGISCNVIAGLVHDHLLVEAERADEAMTILRGLPRRQASGGGGGVGAPDGGATRG